MYILEDLYYGNLRPSERDHPNAEYTAAMARLSDAEERLTSLLDEDGQLAYERFSDCQREVMELSDFYAFREGVRLGVKIMLDVI